LNFIGIAAVIEAVITQTTGGVIGSLDDVLAADAEARRLASERLVGSRGTLSVTGSLA
jgi:1-deoxy-D-xylulose 5-phosphate reductoisomerase